MKQYAKDFIEECARTGSLFFDTPYLETGKRTLTLKDGRPAVYFFNLGGFCDGKSGIILGRAYASKIVEEGLPPGFDILYGPAYKGITIIDSACNELQREFDVNKRWMYRRKEAKGHGELGDFVGAKFSDGCRLLMADDVISSSATKLGEMKEVKAMEVKTGMNISFTGLVLGFDRMQKAVVDSGTSGERKQIDMTASKYFTEQTGLPVFTISTSEEAIPYLYENRVEGPDGNIVVGEKAMREFERYQKEFGSR
jgi:orotate phosphoribosyltransferase